MREAMVTAILEEPELEVVGVAGDGESGLETVRRERPELLVLDLMVPKLSGLRVAQSLRDEQPGLLILGVSSESDAATLYQVRRLGLAGFLDKSELDGCLLREAVAEIRRGNIHISPRARARMAALRADPEAFAKILSRREQEILIRIGGGASDEQVAGYLGIATATARRHRLTIMRKLRVATTAALVCYAAREGFWKPEFASMDLEDRWHLSGQ